VVRGEWAATLILAAVVAADRTALASSYTIVPGGPPVTITTTAVDENATATFSGTAGRSISLNISSVTIGSATVDTTAPDTSLDSSPTNPSSPDVSFAFSSTEAGSTFECSLDGAAFSACTSPQAYSGLTSGSHTFDVRAIDPAGNTDLTPASFTWTVA
jgi:hypothetical protein